MPKKHESRLWLDIGAAAIYLSPDGEYLYTSSRGTANNIAIFKVQKNGKLKFKEKTPTQGNGPRDFTIDPTGKYLLVANQYSNEIVLFKRDLETGSLTDGKKIESCAPVFLGFDSFSSPK